VTIPVSLLPTTVGRPPSNAIGCAALKADPFGSAAVTLKYNQISRISD